MHARYVALASHFTFTPKFCLPVTPTEKPRVEGRVKDLERQWATPVPQAKDLDELNTHLQRCCLAARQRTCGDNTVSVGERLQHDLAAALPVPDRPFDACVLQSAQVDKYQTVHFDNNSYSVPRRFAFRGDGERVRRARRRGRRRAGDGNAPTLLWPPRKSARSPAFFGGFATQTGGPGPRPGLPRLALAASVRRPAPRPRTTARSPHRHPAVYPRPPVAGPPSRRAGRASDPCLPCPRRLRRGQRQRRRRTPTE